MAFYPIYANFTPLNVVIRQAIVALLLGFGALLGFDKNIAAHVFIGSAIPVLASMLFFLLGLRKKRKVASQPWLRAFYWAETLKWVWVILAFAVVLAVFRFHHPSILVGFIVPQLVYWGLLLPKGYRVS